MNEADIKKSFYKIVCDLDEIKFKVHRHELILSDIMDDITDDIIITKFNLDEYDDKISQMIRVIPKIKEQMADIEILFELLDRIF